MCFPHCTMPESRGLYQYSSRSPEGCIDTALLIGVCMCFAHCTLPTLHFRLSSHEFPSPIFVRTQTQNPTNFLRADAGTNFLNPKPQTINRNADTVVCAHLQMHTYICGSKHACIDYIYMWEQARMYCLHIFVGASTHVFVEANRYLGSTLNLKP
jgi:hypothetical protein